MPQSLNRYSYVHNDPVNFVDPSGLLPGLCFLLPNGDGGYRQICFEAGPGAPGGYQHGDPKPGPGGTSPQPAPQKKPTFEDNVRKLHGWRDCMLQSRSIAKNEFNEIDKKYAQRGIGPHGDDIPILTMRIKGRNQ